MQQATDRQRRACIHEREELLIYAACQASHVNRSTRTAPNLAISAAVDQILAWPTPVAVPARSIMLVVAAGRASAALPRSTSPHRPQPVHRHCLR